MGKGVCLDQEEKGIMFMNFYGRVLVVGKQGKNLTKRNKFFWGYKFLWGGVINKIKEG